jgi:hypothetical protein
LIIKVISIRYAKYREVREWEMQAKRAAIPEKRRAGFPALGTKKERVLECLWLFILTISVRYDFIGLNRLGLLNKFSEKINP